jgi:AraC family transcriptional regulator
VTELALRLGYESPDAFSRAFKREFGVTPSEARSPGVRLRVWPRVSFSVVLKGDAAMEFRIERRGEMVLTGLTMRASTEGGANFRDIPAFWEQCHKKGHVEALGRAMNRDSTMAIMGVCMNDFDEATKAFTYLVGIERPRDEGARNALPPGCAEIPVPGGTWAVFPSHGPLPGAIQEVWKRIYSEWFPTSGYEHAERPDLEVYPTGNTSATDYYCEVWLPVRKAGSSA